MPLAANNNHPAVGCASIKTPVTTPMAACLFVSVESDLHGKI